MGVLAQYRSRAAKANVVAVELERVRKIWCRSGNGMVVGLDESAGFMLGGFTTVIKMHAGGGRNPGVAKSSAASVASIGAAQVAMIVSMASASLVRS